MRSWCSWKYFRLRSKEVIFFVAVDLFPLLSPSALQTWRFGFVRLLFAVLYSCIFATQWTKVVRTEQSHHVAQQQWPWFLIETQQLWFLLKCQQQLWLISQCSCRERLGAAHVILSPLFSCVHEDTELLVQQAWPVATSQNTSWFLSAKAIRTCTLTVGRSWLRPQTHTHTSSRGS